jgi:hypothetical protein
MSTKKETKTTKLSNTHIKDDNPLFRPRFSSLRAKGIQIKASKMLIVIGIKKLVADTMPTIKK